MASNTSTSASSSLARYRPAVILLTGLSAALGVYFLHRNYLALSESPKPSTSLRPLRRRNAVHHPGTRRRRGARTNSSSASDTQNLIQQALLHLSQREATLTDYGTFRIELENGSVISCQLLPALLTPVGVLQQLLEVPLEPATRLRLSIENAFLRGFLRAELPPSHTLQPSDIDLLMNAFSERGISNTAIGTNLRHFNDNPEYFAEDSHGEFSFHLDGAEDGVPTSQPLLDREETVADEQSEFSWREGNNDNEGGEGQSLLNLLYHIAEDQARKDGYVHRGVTCNSCGAVPIQGIRYRCANCVDFDLCENCEAMQVHDKTHLFYKVRIPAPFLGNPRQALPVWYPGKMSAMQHSLPRILAKRLMRQTGFENPEIDALWDQFRCLACVEWPEDPTNLGMAIDRRTFDKCFVPNTSLRPPPPNLIYDRMFAFYDTDSNGLIGFEEFLKGLASLNNKSREEKLRRIFTGYDVDSDGYVCRKDFLRMFRAFYLLSKELTRDMVAGMEDEYGENSVRDVVMSSQPISSAFPGSIPAGHESRVGEGKQVNPDGDLDVVGNSGILRENGSDTGDRNEVIAGAAGYCVIAGNSDNEGDSVDGPATAGDTITEDELMARLGGTNMESIRRDDIENALGSYIPLDEITDLTDQGKVKDSFEQRKRKERKEGIEKIREARRQAVKDRWERRRFYTDEEEGATAPSDADDSGSEIMDQANGDLDSPSESEVDSRLPSPRSRSSSKVRFQDSDTFTDYETRSNPSTSSRSIPVGERWGGYEITEAEKDVGKETLYHSIQQGFNELLDQLFKAKEDLAMEADATRADRKKWVDVIAQYEEWELKQEQNDPQQEEIAGDSKRSLPELLKEAGYTVDETVPSEQDNSLSMSQHTSDELKQITAGNGSDGVDRAMNTIGMESRADPTLPQNRPDSNGDVRLPQSTSSQASTSLAMLRAIPGFEEETFQKVGLSLLGSHPDLASWPTIPQVRTWIMHNGVDREAKERGAPAKLSFEEFSERMFEDVQKSSGLGPDHNIGGLGRLAFVGSWIEMASF